MSKPPPKPHRLLRSFACALRGIGSALMSERNMRIHTAAGAVVLWAARFFALSRAEWLILILVIGMVPVCELINTALECTVDLSSPEISPLAKTAKDIAAGAVLLAAMTAAAVGAVLFWDTAALRAVFDEIRARPLNAAILLAAAFLWVTLPGLKNKEKNRE